MVLEETDNLRTTTKGVGWKAKAREQCERGLTLQIGNKLGVVRSMAVPHPIIPWRCRRRRVGARRSTSGEKWLPYFR